MKNKGTIIIIVIMALLIGGLVYYGFYYNKKKTITDYKNPKSIDFGIEAPDDVLVGGG